MKHTLNALLALSLLFFCSCTDTPLESDSWTHQLNTTTEYYIAGPQQSTPPDGNILAKTRVLILKDSGSYSEVKAESGETGFVSTAALSPIE